jgi:hypothetical protein
MTRGTGALLLGAALLASLVVAPAGAIAPGGAHPAIVVPPVPARGAAPPAYVPTQPAPVAVPSRPPYPPTPLPAPTVAGPPTPTPTRYPTPHAVPTPAVSRQDALAQTRGTTFRVTPLRIDRKEAKLMTLGEWMQAGGSGLGGVDPATPVWVVVVWGDFLIGGPLGAPPRHGNWGGRVIQAQTGASFGDFAGPALASWSALPDRDPGPHG